MRASRGLLLAGFLVGAVGILPASAMAKDGTVVVNAPGADNRSVTIRLANLGAPDINNQEYPLATGRKTISGYSLGRVLRAAEAEASDWLDLETLPSVEVDRPTGRPVPFNRTQALGQGDRPPVFYENNGTTVFVMPGTPGREYVFRFTPVAIEIGTAALFQVSLSSSPSRPARGQAVTITAKVSDPPAGETLSYRWSFSDGTPIRTTSVPRVVHRFEGSGPRSVVLTVQSEGGQKAVNSLALDVTGPKEGNSANGKGTGDGGSGAGVGSTASQGPGAGYGSGYGSGSAGSVGSGGGPPVATLAAPPPTQSTKEDPPPDQARDGLEPISGELIGPGATVTELAPGDFPADGAGLPQAEDGQGLLGGAAGEAATILGVGLLMALGGLLEIRVLSRRP